LSGEYRVVVLDEIIYAINKKLVTLEQVERLVEMKPGDKHLVLTGRGAPDSLIEMADMVTNMQNVKHPAQKGISAQKSLDY